MRCVIDYSFILCGNYNLYLFGFWEIFNYFEKYVYIFLVDKIIVFVVYFSLWENKIVVLCVDWF